MTFTEQSLRKAGVAFLQIGLCLTTAHAQDPRPPETPSVIRKTGVVLQGSAAKRVAPTYPPLANAARVGGMVVVDVTVDEEGNVIAARVLSGHPLLNDAAVGAAREWKFKPTLFEGKPVKVIGTITFNFNLDDSKEIEQLKLQLAANPNEVELHFKLGTVYARENRHKEAIEAYEQVLQREPAHPDAYRQIGRSYLRLGEYESAIEALKQSVRLKADRAEELYMDLARCYLKADRFDEAVEAAKQALSIKPDFSYADEAQTMIGHILMNQGRYHDALENLKEAARMSPRIAQIRLYLGTTYVMLGERQLALNEHRLLKDMDEEMAGQLWKLINKQP